MRRQATHGPQRLFGRIGRQRDVAIERQHLQHRGADL
jgi:hypothetical protein